jgi:hypothetical protein
VSNHRGPPAPQYASHSVNDDGLIEAGFSRRAG